MSLRSIGRRHATNQRGGNRCHTRLIFLAAIFSSSTSRGEGWGEVWQPLEWRTTRKRAAKVPRSGGGGRIGLNRCQTRNTISLIANYKPRERGGVCRTYVIQAYKRFAKIRETLQVCFRDGVVTVILSSCARATPFERIVLASRTSPLPATIFRMHAKRGASLFLSTRIRRILRFIFFSFSSFFFFGETFWWNKIRTRRNISFARAYDGFAGCMVLVAKSKWKKEQTHRLCWILRPLRGCSGIPSLSQCTLGGGEPLVRHTSFTLSRNLAIESLSSDNVTSLTEIRRLHSLKFPRRYSLPVNSSIETR